MPHIRVEMVYGMEVNALFKLVLCLGLCLAPEGVVLVDLIVSSEPWVDISQDTTLTCSSSARVLDLTWRKGIMHVGSPITVFYDSTQSPSVIWGDSVDQSHYAFDETSDSFPFTIKSVTLDDEDRYWCRVTEDGTFLTSENSSDIAIRVPPTTVTIMYNSGTYSGGSISVVAGNSRQLTCNVPGIKPAAVFSWITAPLQPTKTQTDTPSSSDNRLVESSNTITVDITETPAQQQLRCGATNRQDGSPDVEVDITVSLQVKVPPKGSMMSLYDSSMDLIMPETSLAVDGGTPYTITCKVQGTRPAVSIQWMVDGAPHQAADPTHSEVNGLIDTKCMLTFTPTRDNHRKFVTCTASTTESESPYPFVTTALDVTGPPDTPVISGSMTMTENVATTLTCTADLGYPDDWTLEWSNEGTAIGNPSDTKADPSGTSQRYMFTSQLEFTPNRQDNTHNIKCTARKTSWTSPEKTWGPINVQYETSITNKHNSFVGIRSGLTANLSCIAKGNPSPVITWFDPNNTEIIHGGDHSKYMLEVSYTTSDSDMTVGSVTISKLTIQAVDPEVDYGVYTCNSTNGIGRPDSHVIIIDGTRRPNTPTGVVRTDRTSSSIAVRWTAGDDGGETQWFHVGHKKTADFSKIFSDKIEGGVTTYNVTGLESYTEYDIRVYAQNDVDRNPNPGSIVEYTLPLGPSIAGFTIEFNTVEGKVTISGLAGKGGCIQLEVKYESSPLEWKGCGECIETDGEVNLAEVCPQTRKRRRRAAGDVVDVRARFCQETGGVELCSKPTSTKEDYSTKPTVQAINPGIVAGVVVGVFLLVVIIMLVYVLMSRLRCHIEVTRKSPSQVKRSDRKRPDDDKQPVYQDVTEMVAITPEAENTTYANLPNAQKAFPRNKLHIVRELGHGNFGKVLLAQAEGILERSKVTLVAVKTLKDGASASETDSSICELELMKKLPEHCNVVKLLGYCVQQDPPYIIVEYLSRGNLKDLLKDSRSKEGRVYGNLHGVSKSLTSRDLMKFAIDVAAGMTFISSQQCIHRDLAARNILVAEDLTCKVSDFGLARDVMNIRVYERGSDGRLPLRWMALESVLDDVYTTKSDVWSYGILLWEIVTLGARPYPAVSAKMMIKKLQNGYRMPKPNHCQEELYRVMLKCWQENSDVRPSFKVICHKLNKLADAGKDCIAVKNYEEAVYEVTITDDQSEKV